MLTIKSLDDDDDFCNVANVQFFVSHKSPCKVYTVTFWATEIGLDGCLNVLVVLYMSTSCMEWYGMIVIVLLVFSLK